MTSSYNGWTASKDRKAIGVVPFTVAGVDFPGGVKGGPVHTVLYYVAEQFNKRVEKLASPGCWGYNYRLNRNANNLSCHSSGTAIDCNAPKHPNNRYPTFNAKQLTAIRAILAEVDHVVRWGGDFHGTKDPMHFEIAGNLAAVKKVADKINAHRKAAATKAAALKPVATKTDPILHVGLKGQIVKDMQLLLIKHGVKVLADGDFGHGTERGVIAFQLKVKVGPADGVVRQTTWNALRK